MAGKEDNINNHKRLEGVKEESGDSLSNEGVNPADIRLPKEIPVLPARDLVAFPAVMMSFYVGRQEGIKAIEAASSGEKLILVLTQKDEALERVSSRDLYRVGVVASLVRVLKLEEDRYKVLIQGLVRVRVSRCFKRKGAVFAEIKEIEIEQLSKMPREAVPVVKRIKDRLQSLVEVQDLPDDLLMVIDEVQDPGLFADLVIAHIKPNTTVSQVVLEETDSMKRLELVDSLVVEEMNRVQVEKELTEKTSSEMTKGQREYFLREQIRLIKQELGEDEEDQDDLSNLKEALEKAKLPKTAKLEADKQLRRLGRMNPELGDAALIRTYLEWFVDLPWSKRTRDKLDLKKVKEVLDADHHGLNRVKNRIIEYLSVRKLNKNSHGPILCLVGPPGVGKTSLGRSVARALGRTFFRVSLGGMRDEAEIRGHRRTYVGALPGRILQGIKQAGTKNPVFVLDELDKIGADFRGDPAAALLEVLDPAQNKEFSDHYLNVPFDLSEVLFIATANTVDTVPSALLDRLEVINLPGYSNQEKLDIGKRFLFPRQIIENGLAKKNISIADDALMLIIDSYTREAGVRNLEREIGSLLRKVARDYAEGNKGSTAITAADVKKLLGPAKFDHDFIRKDDAVGVATGLAWTIYGGEIMTVEASVAKGSGALNLTGQLGDVMQESARAALFYSRANARVLGLDPDFYQKLDIHIHAPQGATPKDGPSAGITIAVALVSALSERKVHRDLAMTGEITLRGNVLPVGGIREKAIAAYRYGIRKVIIPAGNVKDLEEIPKHQRDQLKFIPVKHISEVIDLSMVHERRRQKRKRVKKGEIPKIKVPISGTV